VPLAHVLARCAKIKPQRASGCVFGACLPVLFAVLLPVLLPTRKPAWWPAWWARVVGWGMSPAQVADKNAAVGQSAVEPLGTGVSPMT
jgi:hypothetical protein